MDEQFISISEFAKRAGISKQAVYSRLDNQDLISFVQLDTTGKRPRKLISTKALSLFTQKESRQVDKSISSQDRLLDNLIEALKEQLNQKDKVIEAQQKQIEELTRLLDQQQQLHAMLSKQLALNEQQEEDTRPEPEGTARRGLFSRLFNR